MTARAENGELYGQNLPVVNLRDDRTVMSSRPKQHSDLRARSRARLIATEQQVQHVRRDIDGPAPRSPNCMTLLQAPFG